jgi:hypothetical protein
VIHPMKTELFTGKAPYSFPSYLVALSAAAGGEYGQPAPAGGPPSPDINADAKRCPLVLVRPTLTMRTALSVADGIRWRSDPTTSRCRMPTVVARHPAAGTD